LHEIERTVGEGPVRGHFMEFVQRSVRGIIK